MAGIPALRSRLLEGLGHLVFILYLFTASDFKTIVVPSTIFGIISSLCCQLIDRPSSPWKACVRWPLVLFWVWINLLPFNISNQNQPKAIAEDAINKSWRPLPSRLISPANANILMVSTYAVAVLLSIYLGPFQPCMILILLGTWYNFCGGADTNWVVRNLINSAGYMSFISGATSVALASVGKATWSPRGFKWLFLIAAVIFSTVQMQDLQDQAGDRARGRKSMPLQLGDSTCRVICAAAIVLWSCAIAYFWKLSPSYVLVPLAPGVLVAYRVLHERGTCADKLTFKLWNTWIVAVYATPFFSHISCN